MASWDLMMRSFRVLGRDKRLACFPVVSALACIAVSVPFFLAIFAGSEARGWDAAAWAAIFLWYCSANFVMIFFNCALAACAQRFFEGGDTRLGKGIAEAARRAPGILVWAMVSSTVGVLLRWIDERAGLVGRIATAVVGIGWSMATYLIVPVLVIEDRGVIESIRRSGELLRKTWGEQICGAIAFGWAGLLATVPGIVLGAIGINGFAPLIPVAVLYFVAVGAAFSAARQIFAVALYRYAATGEAPDGYTGEGLRGAVRER